jgi:flagellar biosynthesis protein FlhG
VDAVTIIGGGGGAGATTVVAELACAIATLGRRVAAVDADLGLGNLDRVLGAHPRQTLTDVIAGRCTLPEAFTPAEAGVSLVAAGRTEPVERLSVEERLRALEQVRAITSLFDVLLVDGGSGVTTTGLFFAAATRRIVLVATPATEAQAKTAATLATVVAKLPKASVHILVNRVRTPAEARHTFGELMRLAEPTLCADVHYLGALPLAAEAHESSQRETPSNGHGGTSVRLPALRSAAGSIAHALAMTVVAELQRGTTCLLSL